MPIIEYRREDGTTFEYLHRRMDEPRLEVCPDTGQKVKRLFGATKAIFHGSGFYGTDNNAPTR